LALAVALFLAFAGETVAQGLRFGNHREIKPPDYALLRIGPLYSSVLFQQSAGYRYVRSQGSGVDFLFSNQRGAIREDGHDFPLITALNMRNYLIVTRNIDLDASFYIAYEYYPLDTQENEFIFQPAEEGIAGNFSSEFHLTPFVRASAYDNMAYRTDYVDARGREDRYGGNEYQRFVNNFGLNLDWLMSDKHNLGLDLSRSDNIPTEDEYALQEGFSHEATLIYQYKVLPGLVAGMRGISRVAEYEHPDRADADVNDVNVFFTFAQDRDAGLQLTRSTRLTGELGGGMARSKSLGDGTNETDQNSLTGSVELETKLTRGISHSLSYERRFQQGYLSASELVDALRYRLIWTGDLTTTTIHTSASRVDPSNLDVSDYDAWTSGISITHSLTQFVRLVMSSHYSRRRIRNVPATAEEGKTDPELLYDYNTWVSRIGTRFALTKKIGFNSYYEHVERDSDYGDLAYTRDLISANCTFVHRF